MDRLAGGRTSGNEESTSLPVGPAAALSAILPEAEGTERCHGRLRDLPADV